eukprot:CAMPEP_0119532362 /NCGR_PEP_ID=MMETSP1344-20130328/45894_1 /TAXON_ID=236787 /ORGANISM="Florenciella parvula, Strain CCMP2471" /LENGTH=31 /DNA_ID= /DNA_START= /DNA_END= /DNA_ORIENTATION=
MSSSPWHCKIGSDLRAFSAAGNSSRMGSQEL